MGISEQVQARLLALPKEEQTRLSARWWADCLERCLHHFEEKLGHHDLLLARAVAVFRRRGQKEALARELALICEEARRAAKQWRPRTDPFSNLGGVEEARARHKAMNSLANLASGVRGEVLERHPLLAFGLVWTRGLATAAGEAGAARLRVLEREERQAAQSSIPSDYDESAWSLAIDNETRNGEKTELERQNQRLLSYLR